MGYYFEGDGYRQWIMSMMPNIHSNKNIPQEIKDSWIELALSENIENLHENVAVFENGSMT
jgi:hypothetical protein